MSTLRGSRRADIFAFVSEGYTTIQVRRDEGTAWLRLDRQDAGNALDSQTCGELCAAMTEAAADDGVRVIVLAAEGPVFSVAGDLATVLRVGPPSIVPPRDGAALLAVMRDLPRPIVGVVQGECHSAGMALIAGCDLVLASSRARFWMPELKGGLWPAVPVAALARVIGPRRALELALLGAPIDARAALGLGLVQKLFEPDQLEIEAFVIVRALAQRSPSALRLGLPAFRIGLGEELGEALTRGRAALEGVLSSEDAQEALAAYAARRPPVWRNR
jgi:enoyl-CoA hydratase/carnithine racemase